MQSLRDMLVNATFSLAIPTGEELQIGIVVLSTQLSSVLKVITKPSSFVASRVSFCTFLAHEYPDLVHKVVMINGGGPTALEPSLCSIFQLPSCILHCLSPCLAWSFLK